VAVNCIKSTSYTYPRHLLYQILHSSCPDEYKERSNQELVSCFTSLFYGSIGIFFPYFELFFSLVFYYSRLVRLYLYCSAHCFNLVQSISSSLGANLSGSTTRELYPSGSSGQANIDQTDMCFLEEDMDVPEIVEEIIDFLLTGLRDSVCF
jgi:hypothetical protein